MQNETELVLVECINTFRTRYMVEVPVGKDYYALDTVTMNEAKEFSQEYLGEQIVSHRVIEFDESMQMCDADNAYCADWDIDLKQRTFFTEWNDNDDV